MVFSPEPELPLHVGINVTAASRSLPQKDRWVKLEYLYHQLFKKDH
jgi:hypothetical protein